jgi:AbrB family looped-hinge helix DNA binding protein
MATATVTSKGQITIPKKVRQALHLAPGDRVEFLIDGSGKVLVRPGKADVADLKGLLHKRGRRAVSITEMERAIERGHRSLS